MKMQGTAKTECLGLNSMSWYRHGGLLSAEFAPSVQGLITETSRKVHGSSHSQGSDNVVQALFVAPLLSQVLLADSKAAYAALGLNIDQHSACISAAIIHCTFLSRDCMG